MRVLQEGIYPAIVPGWTFRVQSENRAIILKDELVMGHITCEWLHRCSKCNTQLLLDTLCMIADVHLWVRRLADD